MCMVDDVDAWDFYSSEKRRAAKDHKCCDCCRTITKGERYHYATGKSDCNWSVFHLCAHCTAAAWWLDAACGGWLYDYIGTELEEHWDEGYTDLTIGRLIVGWRRKWRRWDGTLMPVPEPRRIVWADSRSAYDRQILRYERLDVAA